MSVNTSSSSSSPHTRKTTKQKLVGVALRECGTVAAGQPFLLCCVEVWATVHFQSIFTPFPVYSQSIPVYLQSISLICFPSISICFQATEWLTLRSSIHFPVHSSPFPLISSPFPVRFHSLSSSQGNELRLFPGPRLLLGCGCGWLQQRSQVM